MGFFENSITKVKDLIKFEMDRSGKTLSSIEKDQWELKTIGIIEVVGDEWNKFSSAPPSETISLQVQFLTFQALSIFIRSKILNVKKTAPVAYWEEVDSLAQEFATSKELFSREISHRILTTSVEAVEKLLTHSEWVIQTPRRWNFKWDQKEDLNIKIDFLSKEIRTYKDRFDQALASLGKIDRSASSSEFQWPQDLESTISLLKLGSIHRPKGPCGALPDPRLTATLLTKPQECITILKQQITTSEKSLQELQKKNTALQDSLKQILATSEAGNYLQAEEALKQIPPFYRLNDQREIMDSIQRIKQRVAHIEAISKKLIDKDLQKLDWGAIEDFCEEVREGIHNFDDSATDYEKQAYQLVRIIERHLKAHKSALLTRWITIISIAILLILGFYFIRPSVKKMALRNIHIETLTNSTTWKVYKRSGELLRDGKGSQSLEVPEEIYYVVFQKDNRSALDRILWNNIKSIEISEKILFAHPQVRLQVLDSSGKNPINTDEMQLLVDLIPVPYTPEGIHIPKGTRRFTIQQKGQPDFDSVNMISQKIEQLTLISPWVAVDIESNVADLFISINNSTKRLIPNRFFLPLGNHEAIFTDSRGDIRETRRIIVEGVTENYQKIGVPSGILNIQIQPKDADIRLVVNEIIHTTKNGFRELALSAGEHRIQLFQSRQLIHESTLILPADSKLEKEFNIEPPRP